jgi:antitoxin component YwqK of YwqJK toxin-antitoxin module
MKIKNSILFIPTILLTTVVMNCSLRTPNSEFSVPTASINDISKRNGNWCWYIAEGTTVGEWRTAEKNDTPPDGKYTFFYGNGNLGQRQTLHDGRRCDTTFTYDLNGNLQSYTTYTNNDTFDYYLHNGPYKDYNLDGSIYLTGTVKDHSRTGEWIWYKSNDRKDYTETYLDSITTIRIKNTARFVNHKQDGVVKCWYKNGNLEQACLWRMGIQDSTSIFYYENGKVKNEINWKKGKRHGLSISYSDDGKIQKQTKYIQGQKITSTD